MEQSDNDRTRSHIALAKDTIVSHYRIIEKIGSGGMGEVYLAADTELERKVALKFLPPHLCEDEDCRRRFKREAQAAAKLSHPNIIHVYEVSEFHGRPFFAMEHVEGLSLKEFASGKEPSIEQILELGIQVCDGLHKAHQKGVTHRDIKPSNIIIDSHGRAKIVDFGLASVVGTDQLTKTGSTLGTIGYMSPEQVRGQETDHRSDLFSLGVVLYELITRQNPFRRDSDVATLKAVSDDTPEPLGRFKSGLPEELQTVIDKALDKDVRTRYQHADGMLADLNRVKRSLESSHSGASVPAHRARSYRLQWLTAIVVLVAVAIILLVAKPWMTETARFRKEKIMLAVLPFENLGDPGDEYFADGITEEITTSLARLSGLGVISRTSSMQYKDTEKSLREIGKELKVDCVLEGTIRWDKLGDSDRVRINPQLIRVNDDVHLWADRYDAVLTDVFAVQSMIAREVASALDVALLQTEKEALETRVDIDPAAYDYYLKGKQYFSIARYRQPDIHTARRLHLKAIELAPDFAPAYAELASVYTETYWEGIDTGRAILDTARQLCETALDLAPETPEPYQALGWYYYHGLLDFERALDAFSKVLEMQPNNSLAVASIAYVHRRQGKWDEAIAGLNRAVQLNPREPWYYHELGNCYSYLRRFDKAIEAYDLTIDLDPENVWAYFAKSWVVLGNTGDPGRALEVTEEGFLYSPHSPSLNYLSVYYHLCAGEYEQALARITGPGDLWAFSYSEADYYYIKGRTLEVLGQNMQANSYFDTARGLVEETIAGDSTVPGNYALLGKIYACLGLRDEAVAAARKGVEMLPISVDALDGPRLVWDLATVYATLGEEELALAQLDTLLSTPGETSVKWLKVAPEFMSLRDNPGFEKLIEKYDKEHAI